jgi:hypothetical protein
MDGSVRRQDSDITEPHHSHLHAAFREVNAKRALGRRPITTTYRKIVVPDGCTLVIEPTPHGIQWFIGVRRHPW